MAHAKIKKIIGNVNKILFFSRVYRKYVILILGRTREGGGGMLTLYGFSPISLTVFIISIFLSIFNSCSLRHILVKFGDNRLLW